jgi:TetR/AcrR family transcriptional regulator, cholesterol catabolism regulator
MREEIRADKRERILAEAVRLFYLRGYSGTTLDDIAHAIGVTKPFIYTHFRGKADLLAAVCVPTIELSLGAVAEAAERAGTPTQRLRWAVADFTRVVLRRQAEIAIFFREEKSVELEAMARINLARKQFDHVLSAMLDDGVAAGEFAITDTHLAALAIGGMISWAYTWHRPNGRLPLDDLAGEMAELALGMAGARRVTVPSCSAKAEHPRLSGDGHGGAA